MIDANVRRRHFTRIAVDRRANPVDPWRWVETAPNAVPLSRSETLFALSNGFVGMRGNPDEGRDSHHQGTFVNGFHETWPIHHAEDAYGLARLGQTMVNAPDTKTIRLYIDDEPLRVNIADLYEYERAIDFRDGILRRSLLWRTPSGKLARVESTRMVSMTDKHLAVMTLEVTMVDSAAPIAVSSQILNRQDGEDEVGVSRKALGSKFDPRQSEEMGHRVLEPRLHEKDEGTDRMLLGYRCANSGMTIAVGMDHRVETDDEMTVSRHIDEDNAKVIFHVDATPGTTFRMVKFAAYHTSRHTPARELSFRCRRTLNRGMAAGAEALHAGQRSWFDGFWERSDVEIGEEPEIQQAVRWNLFQLAQASARAETQGIPAKGLTGSGYSGHYFWDTEIYVLPFLTYTSPELARNALRFRYSMLPSARARAQELGHDGALYPWRTINGHEASAYYAAGTAQYHIDADISHALVKYIEATGDHDFAVREGIDILVETARMWFSLGFFDDAGVFNIHGVTGPDEYTTVVNNNLYTNLMARHNLRAARYVLARMRREQPASYSAAVERLGVHGGELDDWRRASESMMIPFDRDRGIHPQDQHFLEREFWDLDGDEPKRPLLLHYHPLVIYRHQILKQADVVLALFLRGDEFTREQKTADYTYYDKLTTGDSTLSAVVQSIVAAEIGKRRLALRFFLTALFTDLADVHDNTEDGVHVASTGGVWSGLVSGFGGMRDHGGRFSFDPRLPEGWPWLRFRMNILGNRTTITVRADEVEFRVADESHGIRGAEVGPVEVTVRGEPVLLEPGTHIVVSYTPEPVDDDDLEF